MPEKIVECPRCGKEICVNVEVLNDLILISQDETIGESIKFILNHPGLKIGKVTNPMRKKELITLNSNKPLGAIERLPEVKSFWEVEQGISNEWDAFWLMSKGVCFFEIFPDFRKKKIIIHIENERLTMRFKCKKCNSECEGWIDLKKDEIQIFCCICEAKRLKKKNEIITETCQSCRKRKSSKRG